MVRPRPWKLALYLLFAVLLVALGVLLLWAGSVLIGLLSIVFFGCGTVWVIVKTLQRGTSQLTLTREGIEPATGGLIPWRDVESVGVVYRPTKMVVLRLHDHDGYLETLPRRGIQGGMLRFNRRTFGHDMGFSPAWLDRSPEDFADLLEQWRSR